MIIVMIITAFFSYYSPADSPLPQAASSLSSRITSSHTPVITMCRPLNPCIFHQVIVRIVAALPSGFANLIVINSA
jgi:hypothetical protein